MPFPPQNRINSDVHSHMVRGQQGSLRCRLSSMHRDFEKVKMKAAQAYFEIAHCKPGPCGFLHVPPHALKKIGAEFLVVLEEKHASDGRHQDQRYHSTHRPKSDSFPFSNDPFHDVTFSKCLA